MEDLKKQLEEIKQELVIQEQEPPKPTINDKVDDLVGDLINTATIGIIQENQDTKNKVLQTAKTIVDTKVETAVLQAKTDNAKANFDNKKEACACFGFADKEDSLPKSAVNAMNGVHNFWLAIWIAVCSFTLCPVNFIAKRMHNTIKKTWIALLVAIVIYISVVAGIPTLIVTWIKSLIH